MRRGVFNTSEQGTESHFIPFESEATDHATTGGSDEGVVTVVLTCKDITDVDLDLGGGDGEEGVTQGNRSVTVATEVDN